MLTKKDPNDPFWYLARKCAEEVKTWTAWKRQGLEELEKWDRASDGPVEMIDNV